MDHPIGGQERCRRCRHQIESFLPSGILNRFTGANPSERAAASTFERVIVAYGWRGRSLIMSAFSICGQSNWCLYEENVSPSGNERR
jgi:hypothetical protein